MQLLEDLESSRLEFMVWVELFRACRLEFRGLGFRVQGYGFSLGFGFGGSGYFGGQAHPEHPNIQSSCLSTEATNRYFRFRVLSPNQHITTPPGVGSRIRVQGSGVQEAGSIWFSEFRFRSSGFLSRRFSFRVPVQEFLV